MNDQIRKLGLVLMVLFGLLFLQLNRLQVVEAEKLAEDPRNTRVAIRDFSRQRGAIQTSDNVIVARSVPSEGTFERQRQYPEGALFGHITGFFSFSFGSTGVERVYSSELSGRNLGLRPESLRNIFVDPEVTGNVTLTLTKALQEQARNLLGERKGSIVVLDPGSGGILAMWSAPSYDPSPLAAHDQKTVQEAYNALTKDPGKPMRGRAFQERFFPGSTFKIVTAAAAIERQPELVTKAYPQLRELDLPLTDRNLANFGRGQCGGTLPDIMRVSCNTAFAQMGLDLGAENLHGEASDFGFNARPPIDLTATVISAFPDADAFVRNEPALAQSAIGQNSVSATPLQMALIAAGVANDGVIMKPHVMAEIRDSDGELVRTYDPSTWKVATTPDTARQLRDLMAEVVARGTATRAQVAGAFVAGKTGTAQVGDKTAHAWFIGFAEGNGRKVAVAVIIENQPEVSEATGGRVAAPIAGQLMKSALGL